MPSYEYTTHVLTGGLLGRHREELVRKDLEAALNRHGAEGWQLDKIQFDVDLHGEKDGHLLILRREVG